MKIGVGYCYYNDLESIKRGLPTFVNEVDYVFAIDGRFSLRDGPDYSDDGSTEYIKQFSNVVYEGFVGLEHDKRNQYIRLAVEYKVDVLIVMDSDEYVFEADWKLFKHNLEKILGNKKDNFFGLGIIIDASGGLCHYPRIWIRPNEIKYDKAHCIFNVNGSIFRSPPNCEPVLGIVLKTGDELRTEEYLKKNSEYQGRMLEYEIPLRKALKKGKWE